jgi:hypothetical protein
MDCRGPPKHPSWGRLPLKTLRMDKPMATISSSQASYLGPRKRLRPGRRFSSTKVSPPTRHRLMLHQVIHKRRPTQPNQTCTTATIFHSPANPMPLTMARQLMLRVGISSSPTRIPRHSSCAAATRLMPIRPPIRHSQRAIQVRAHIRLSCPMTPGATTLVPTAQPLPRQPISTPPPAAPQRLPQTQLTASHSLKPR